VIELSPTESAKRIRNPGQFGRVGSLTYSLSLASGSGEDT
jgi:hypothetical protein